MGMFANLLNANTYMITDMLYNEQIKGKVFGICNLVGRFGGILASLCSEFVNDPEIILIILPIIFACSL